MPLVALCFRCDLQIGYICLVSAKIAVRKSPAKQEANHPLNISTKRFYGDLTLFCHSRLGIQHKPGSFRNNGNTLRYNINSTSASNFTMYFAITKSEY